MGCAMTEREPLPIPSTSGDVELWLRLDGAEVRSGDLVRGTLVVHNTAAASVVLTGSPTRAATVIAEDGAVVGRFAGWHTDEGMHRVVDPDRIVYLPVLGGTASATGSTVPGRYRVVASLEVAALDGSNARRLLSRAVPLRVTD